MLFCVGSTNNPWPWVTVHCYFRKHWGWYSAVPGQTTQVIKKTSFVINQMNIHTHKQAMDNALSDGQSSRGVVSGPFSLTPEGASAEQKLCHLGVPWGHRVTDNYGVYSQNTVS